MSAIWHLDDADDWRYIVDKDWTAYVTIPVSSTLWVVYLWEGDTAGHHTWQHHGKYITLAEAKAVTEALVAMR